MFSFARAIQLNNFDNRFKIYQGNLFDALNENFKKYDLIYSNIAQLPLKSGEASSLHDHGGVDGWQFLDIIIDRASVFLNAEGYLAFMIFDFLGY